MSDPIKSIAVPVTRRQGKDRLKSQVGLSSPYQPVTADARRHRASITANAAHRYAIGERLAMSQGGRDISRVASICVVVALLPHESGPRLYRVRSESEGFERIVNEIDLTVLDQP